MRVTTQSGKIYTFVEYEGSFRFQYGIHEGVVDKFISLEVGKPLELNFYPLDLITCKPKSDIMFMASADPIISITP